MTWPKLEGWKSFHDFQPKWAFQLQMTYLFGLGLFVILYRAGNVIHPAPDFFGPLPFLVPWFGAVGAVILSISGVIEHRKDWDPGYRYWYYSRPFIGAVTSTISVLIFQSGIVAVGGNPPQDTNAPIKNVLYYVIAFIAGYRENTFRELVRRVGDIIFSPGQQPTPPVIASVTPVQAPYNTPTTVTLAGSGFTGTTAVKLDNHSIPFVTDSDTQLTVSIPAIPPPTPQAPTTMNLLVTNGVTSTSVTFTVA